MDPDPVPDPQHASDKDLVAYLHKSMIYSSYLRMSRSCFNTNSYVREFKDDLEKTISLHLRINSLDSYVPPYAATSTNNKIDGVNSVSVSGDATKDCTPCRRKVSHHFYIQY
jgi:hypothetical protein